jgi:hypothetical protein
MPTVHVQQSFSRKAKHSDNPLVSETLANAFSKIRLSTREERAQNFAKRALVPRSRHHGPAFGPRNVAVHRVVPQAVMNEAVRAAAAVEAAGAAAAPAHANHNNAELEELIMGPDAPRHRGGRHHKRSTRRSKKSRRRRSTRRRA